MECGHLECGPPAARHLSEYTDDTDVTGDCDDNAIDCHRRGENSGQQNGTNARAGFDDDCLEACPRISPQDESAELQSLTIPEIMQITSDLTGVHITEGGGGITTNVEFRQHIIRRLDDELRRIPSTDKLAYYCAIESSCPDAISIERKLAFVEYNNGSIPRAAKQIVSYWQGRLEVFGAERAYLPMALSGTLQDEVLNFTSMKTLQPLPMKDTAGRTVLFFTPARRNLAVYTERQEVMALWYLFDILMDDPMARRNGVVMVGDVRLMQWKHSSRKFGQYFRMMDPLIPVTKRGLHICYPSSFYYHMIAPVVKRIGPKSLRLRLKVHYGDEEPVLSSLAAYCLPKRCLPKEIGGDVELDTNQWVIAQLQREKAVVEANMLHATETETSQEIKTAEGNEMAAPGLEDASRYSKSHKRARFDTSASESPSSGSDLTMDVSSSSIAKMTDRQLYEVIVHERAKSKTGRATDPRMAAAVLLALDKNAATDASAGSAASTITNALIDGGFIFLLPRKDVLNTSSRLVKDVDGVTLKQHQDQLRRRLKQAREWIDMARQHGDVKVCCRDASKKRGAKKTST